MDSDDFVDRLGYLYPQYVFGACPAGESDDSFKIQVYGRSRPAPNLDLPVPGFSEPLGEEIFDAAVNFEEVRNTIEALIERATTEV